MSSAKANNSYDSRAKYIKTAWVNPGLQVVPQTTSLSNNEAKNYLDNNPDLFFIFTEELLLLGLIDAAKTWWRKYKGYAKDIIKFSFITPSEKRQNSVSNYHILVILSLGCLIASPS